jgi:serine/threonine-protein kinase HipA
MTERVVDVFLAMGGEVPRVGRLWTRARSGRESASFEYDASWLARRDAFSLDPELELGAGQFHTERPLFNAFTDPAPDRWGQTLLRRNERIRAKAEGRAPRTLLTIDTLTLVDDETRLGALRFRAPDGDAFLTLGHRRIPPLIELPRLLRATSRLLDDEETDDDLALLLAPGTSLGGARPKATVRNTDGKLAIAKFPSQHDDWPVTSWEAATLAMAEAAGIAVPKRQFAAVLKKPVLIIERFDRRGSERLPYMSALTAMAARDGEPRSYLELAEVLRASGASPARDLEELWRRIVFNVLVSNVDDHLRNHGFLREPGGWRLAPAFDLNPVPIEVRPRVHALAIDEEDPSAPLERVLSIAGSFNVKEKRARAIAREVAGVTRRWRRFASDCGLSQRQLDRMASAFEHDDAEAAREL